MKKLKKNPNLKSEFSNFPKYVNKPRQSQNSFFKQMNLRFGKTSLNGKAVMLSLAICGLPTFGITALSYHLGNQIITNYVSDDTNVNTVNQLEASQKQLLLMLLIGTASAALLAGISAATLACRLLLPIHAANEAVKKLANGNLNSRIPIKGKDEFAILSNNINLIVEQLQDLLFQQRVESEQSKLLSDAIISVSQSLNNEDLFNKTVTEIRQILGAHRVIIYQCNSDGEGQVIAEEIAPGLPIAFGETIEDISIVKELIEVYTQAEVLAINNVDEAGLSAEHLQLMRSLKIKAVLLTPIFKDNKIFGFLIAHHCWKPHFWQAFEINFLKKLAIQVGLTLEGLSLLKTNQVIQEQFQTKEVLQQQIVQLIDNIEAVSSGDLTVRAEVTSGEIGTVAESFNSIIENLREIVIQVNLTATEVNSAIAPDETAINQLVINTDKQAVEINRTSDALREMRSSIKSIAKGARKAATVASKAFHTAQAGGTAMDLTVENIHSLRETIGDTAKKVKLLGESSQKISHVVSLINQIAMRTNLLAINAGIEATRAGEQGQGFAIVAEEIAVLATRSSDATAEIEEIVTNIQRETSEVVKAMELGITQVVEETHLIEDTKQNLNEILDVSHQIDGLVESISAATVIQVKTSKQVTNLMKEIAQISQSTSNCSTSVSLSLQKTLDISNKLAASVDGFKVS
ncbi:MAG: methyl-accepting chemotaxis protein [Rivularia sp. (in: cyanobacteria)]